MIMPKIISHTTIGTRKRKGSSANIEEAAAMISTVNIG